MSFRKNLIGGIALCLLLSACNHQAPNDSTLTLVSASKIAQSGAPRKVKSEEYAKAAEVLLTAQGFEEADRLAKLALEQDSKNLRAQFIRAVTSVIMVQKGIYARMSPLIEKHPAAFKEYQLAVIEMKVDDKKNINNFLLNGKADIATEDQFQSHLDLTAKAIGDFRKFAKANKDSELTIKANADLVPDLIERYANSCEIKETANLEYELVCPSHLQRYEVTFNGADFEAMAAAAAMYETAFILYNGYDLSGAVQIAAKYAEVEDRSTEVILQDLFKNSSFGKLRKAAKLTEIKNLGLDLVKGLNWAIRNQNTLCPKGNSHSHNRIGKWANKGLCLPPVVQPLIEKFEKVFNGEAIDQNIETPSGPYPTQVAYGAFFIKPTQDLRALGPFRFDRCNQLLTVGDQTLGGVFPNADADKIHSLQASECKK